MEEDDGAVNTARERDLPELEIVNTRRILNLMKSQTFSVKALINVGS